MISESHTRYGSRVFCHGSVWRPWRRCHAINRVAKVAASRSGRLGTPDRRHDIVQAERLRIADRRRAGARLIAHRFEQFARAVEVALHALVMALEFGDPRFELAGGGLHPFERFMSAAEIAATL